MWKQLRRAFPQWWSHVADRHPRLWHGRLPERAISVASAVYRTHPANFLPGIFSGLLHVRQTRHLLHSSSRSSVASTSPRTQQANSNMGNFRVYYLLIIFDFVFFLPAIDLCPFRHRFVKPRLGKQSQSHDAFSTVAQSVFLNTSFVVLVGEPNEQD